MMFGRENNLLGGNMPKVEKLKHLTTIEVKKTLVGEPRLPTPGPRGPAVGEANLSDRDFVSLHSRPEDWAAMRAVLVARRAAAATDAPGVWRTLPDGSKIRATTVLAGCTVCGEWRWIEEKHMPTPCQCFGARTKGVMMRPATPEETRAWFVRETAKEEKFRLDRPAREAMQKAYFQRQLEDGKFR